MLPPLRPAAALDALAFEVEQGVHSLPSNAAARDKLTLAGNERMIAGYRVTVCSEPLPSFTPTLRQHHLIDVHPSVVCRDGRLLVEPLSSVSRAIHDVEEEDAPLRSARGFLARPSVVKDRSRPFLFYRSRALPKFKAARLHSYGFEQQEATTKVAAAQIERVTARWHGRVPRESRMPQVEEDRCAGPARRGASRTDVPEDVLPPPQLPPFPPIDEWPPQDYHCKLFLVDHRDRARRAAARLAKKRALEADDGQAAAVAEGTPQPKRGSIANLKGR
eukprot:Polyplicarium_translucidae@DN798_c0_g1_i1.p1